MFMHFPCICTSFHIFLLLWIVLELFWLSLSFPSLFLFTLVVSMAPKCKSTLAWNPLHSSVYSSSDHAPLSLCFCNDDAYKAFAKKFSRWGIYSERRVILGHFANTDLPTVIHSQEWESLCDELVTCLFLLIQEFYSNMHGIDYSIPHFVTRVWGISILVTSQLVTDVLRVTRIEFPNYPSYERLRTVSKDELMSTFCEHLSEWGECQFTYY